MIPSIGQLHTVILSAQGEPTGLRRDTSAARRLAADLDPAQLQETLEGSPDLPDLLGALTLAPLMPPVEGDRRAMDAALIRLISDDRVHRWGWGPRPWQRSTFEVGRLAAEALLAAVERAMPRLTRRDDPPDPAVEAALAAALDAALANMAGPEAARAVMRGFRQLGSRLSGRVAVAERLAGIFVEAASQSARVAALRCMAARELQRQVDPRPQEIAAVFAAAREAVIQALLEVVDDDEADAMLRRQIRPLLMDIAPTLINDLQRDGRLRIHPMPPSSALMSQWGRPLEEPIAAAARCVSVAAVLDGLDSQDPERFAAAACVAPAIAPRAGWEALAARLIAAIPRDELHQPHGQTGELQGADLGELAAERLIRLLSPMLRGGDDAPLKALHSGLARALERPVIGRPGAQDLARRFREALRWSQAQERSAALFEPVAASSTEGSSERFAALLLMPNPSISREIFFNPGTPPCLKALIGEHLLQWCPSLIEELVTIEGERWSPSRGTTQPAPPIGEPGDKVPLEWLVASVAQSGHTPTRLQAVRRLGVRLSRGEASAQAARARLLPLVDEALLEGLRAAIDHKVGREAPRWQAAVALALIGDQHDEARLVDFMATYGPWTRLDPRGEAIQTARIAEHLLLRPLNQEKAHHLLEAQVFVGFGEERARRLMARAFTQLGGRAQRAGSLDEARRAFQQALDFDPLNLDARRAARSSGL